MSKREMLCLAGDWLHCDGGHKAFQAKRDIALGEVVWSHDLRDMGGERPRQNAISSCPVCGRGVSLGARRAAA